MKEASCLTTTAAHYEYDVALSFAGEDRKYAKQLADRLTKKNVRVFYDEYEKAELWGKDLYEHLAVTYKDLAFYCVMFISAHYASKLWTTHERRNAQARAFKENREYILPLRLDDTEIPGISPTVGYRDLRHDSIDEICELILKKLSNLSPSELSKVTVSVRPSGRGSSDSAVIDNVTVGRILTGSTDDLVFTIEATDAVIWNTITIWVPPGFKIPSVVSQMSDDQPRIQVVEASKFNPYGPQWTIVYIPADTTTYGDAGISRDSHQNPLIEVTSIDERYEIRIKKVTAPSIAGRYFFKVALFEESFGREESNIGSTGIGQSASRFIPSQDWPVLIVKGELNLATITGIIRRTGDKTAIAEPGKVWAKMTSRLDPNTSQARPDLPLVDAVGYFSATAKGHYEVEGVASGIYDLYASAAGYPKNLMASGITILKDQHLLVDGDLQPGPVIYGDVSGDKPWPESAAAKIELYLSPTFSRIPDSRSRLVSWSPSRVVARQKIIGRMRGPQDVGPPQRWQVQGGTTIPFHFEFGEKGQYGAPTDFDGMVPQLYATWTNGLLPGRYFVRAWVSRYNQSAEDGATFLEYFFDVMPNMRDNVKLNIRLHSK